MKKILLASVFGGMMMFSAGANAVDSTAGGTQKMVLAFLENNMEQYAMDAARGQGETIDTLAGIMNVDSEKLGEVSKQNFAFLFPDQDVQAVDVTLNLFTLVG